MTGPSDWATRQLAGATDVPAYGSDAWHALAEDDPRRVQAAIAAAELWQQTLPAVVAAVDVIVGLDDEVHERQTVRRRAAADSKRRADRAIDDTVQRLTRRTPQPREMVQTDDWPLIRRPEPRRVGLPSTAAMIRRVS